MAAPTDSDDDFLFQGEGNTTDTVAEKAHWKVLIVDDEKDIHEITKLTLRNFNFDNKDLEFVSAYSGREARELIQQHPDIAIILLDVVMEEDDAGLKFARHVREDLKNTLVRIILRTGQPGIAPQGRIAIDYDINDYKEKTELTKEKFFASIIMALRTFKTLQDVEKHIKESINSSTLATRLEKLNKEYGTTLLVSEESLVKLSNAKEVNYRWLGKFPIPGKKDPISVYDVYDSESKKNIELKNQTKAAFEEAVKMYLDKKLPEAAKAFKKIVEINPEDEAAKKYIRVINQAAASAISQFYFTDVGKST